MALPHLLYLPRWNVAAVDPSYDEMIDAVEQAYQDFAAGKAFGHCKLVSITPSGSFFYALSAYSETLGVNLCHNSMGVPHEQAPPGEHHLNGLAVLSDYRTAKPLAVIDTFWISTWIPAAVSGVTLRRLARKDSKVLGLVATGAQARVHLPACRAVLPIEKVVAFNRSRSGAEAFAEEARAQGVDVEIVGDGNEVLDRSDVVVTSIPVSAHSKPFLDPGRVRPGQTLSMVDLGRSWLDGVKALDRLVTDDHAQAEEEYEIGRFRIEPPFDTDLRELVTGKRPGRESDDQRIAICHSGHSVGVMALMALVYRIARQKGIGSQLPANWTSHA